MSVNPITKRARALRNAPTDAEKKLWSRLRASQLGVKFRRQYPIGPYIADLACKEKNLVIEIDGGQHNMRQNYDQERTRYIEQNGFTVLRFWNNDVLQNIEGVMKTISSSISPPVSAVAETAPPQAGGDIPGKESQKTPPPFAGGLGGDRSSSLDKIKIIGGKALHGDIPISGAKNSALKLMCAALLSDQAVQFENMPNSLRDIASQVELLEYLGCAITRENDAMTINAGDIQTYTAPYDIVRKMRGSILVLGPLLARFGEAKVSLPGGCAIGTRPVDLHIKALEEMGADINLDGGYINATAPKGGLQGAKILFPKVSVGATENLLMAATLANGTTILANAAREPEIMDLGQCLISMGAKIEGLGTDTIRIEGVKSLNGTHHRVVPDRIETGTYMIAAGMTGGKLRLQNANLDHLSAAAGLLSQTGIDIDQDGEDIIVARDPSHPLKGIDIMTEPHPGFPTDLQAQFMAMLSIAKGAGMVTETIFENRFMHVPELNRMGADITVQGNSAIVRGVDHLTGAEVMATDLRASVALVLAGLVANGETTVNRIYHLERGYEDIVGKLSRVGADIGKV